MKLKVGDVCVFLKDAVEGIGVWLDDFDVVLVTRGRRMEYAFKESIGKEPFYECMGLQSLDDGYTITQAIEESRLVKIGVIQ